jgi:hypothetical protein
VAAPPRTDSDFKVLSFSAQAPHAVVVPPATTIMRAIFLLLAITPASRGAWVTFINTTAETVIVQGVTTVNGKAVRGKAVKLAAGATYRLHEAATVTKTIEVLKPAPGGDTLLTSKEISVKAEDLKFEIQAAKGNVSLVATSKSK